MFKLVMRWIERDPLKRILLDAPLELITAGARAGGRKVAEHVKMSAEATAPWDSGHLAGAHTVWERKSLTQRQLERDVLSSWQVRIPRRRFGGYYYPLAMEFGWDDAPEGFPWLRKALYANESEAVSIYRHEMRNVLGRGAKHV